MNRPKRIAVSWLSVAVLLALAPALSAQMKPKTEKAPPGPAPEHDISGIWTSHNPPDIRHFIGETWTKEPPDLTPWGEAQFKLSKASNGGAYTLDQTNDPVIHNCFPPGVPRIYMQPFPMEIIQQPNMVVFIYEYDHTVRHVYTDRPHPQDPDPTYMGDSIGDWEGNTFVVDTIGFNTKTWLDRIGHQHSDQLHVIERFTRTDYDHMQIDVTMIDPKALAKPWTQTIYYELKPDWHIMEQVCTDNWSFLNFEK